MSIACGKQIHSGSLQKSQTTRGAIAKGIQISITANCMRNLRIACNIDLVGNLPLGKLNLKFKK
jgi:hypothetical protein